MRNFCTALQTFLTFFSAKTDSIFAYDTFEIFNVSFIDDVVSFEHPGPVFSAVYKKEILGNPRVLDGRTAPRMAAMDTFR